MATFIQLIKRQVRKKKNRKTKAPLLWKCPQKRAVCNRVYIMKPKKPNSASRKVAKVTLSTKRAAVVSIRGQGHNLQSFSVVLVRGGRVKDLPGVQYRIIRGKYDFHAKETFDRKERRSKFSIKREQRQ